MGRHPIFVDMMYTDRKGSDMFFPVLRNIIAFSLLTAAGLHADLSKENFYNQAKRMVIRLERRLPNGIYAPVGTAFFVSDEQNSLFVVTARHVASLGVDLRARVPTLLIAGGKTTDVIELRLPSSLWIYHENSGDNKTFPVDVAVMKLGNIKDRAIVSFRYCPKSCPKDEYNQLADDPMPPDQVVIFGFPQDLGFTLKEQRPMTRAGVVALTEDEEAFVSILQADGTQKLLPKGVYLIDARMYPGNSGGPIIVSNPLSQIRLGGLVSASNANLDYGIATPVSQIVQTLERARNAPPNMEAWFVLEQISAK
jgi:hypothetical protein